MEEKHVLRTGSFVVAAKRKIISSLSASRWWQEAVRQNARHDVNEIDENETDEELMTLIGGVPADRWYTKLNVDGHTERVLLDCGATVNLIPESVVRSLGHLDDMRPAVSAATHVRQVSVADQWRDKARG